ncbi:hypothetical protein CPB84DRAFT_1772625 [Gymnopilus junonius]|uniref:F-box domain-containing protein n=1 Tax=Gymnopilus junonius TaxID=109634 RepID=A0A9P5TP46_GYMJU|nr:hypothetical protein CPB84DRAFT_1772625 [Gymnopilus junonius]
MTPENTEHRTEPRGILQLHEDILTEIFLWNANIFTAKNCVVTTRSASQVCQSWRSILLCSSSVWGRLMDLDTLNQKSNAWRQEILSRSGQSLLWIVGSKPSTTSQSFLFDSLLSLHWERIEHLQIRNIMKYYLSSKAWDNLRRPAPNLRSCSLEWYSGADQLFSESSAPLFADYAPLLCHFSVSHVKLDLNSAWFSNLRHLDFRFQLTTADVLQTLQSMVHLEFLGISGDGEELLDDDRPSQLPTVVLPNLTELRLNHSSVNICSALLGHIRPADNCRLSFETSLDPKPHQSDLDQLSNSLSSLFRCYLHSQAHSIPQIHLMLLDSHCIFECSPDIAKPWHVEHSSPKFKMCFYAWSHPIWTILPMLSTFDLSAIQKLHLMVNTQTNVFPSQKVLHFMSFFSRFSSVTHIELQEVELHAIYPLSILADRQPIFPRLQTLHLDTFNTLDHHHLLDFLRFRRDIGQPISTVFFAFLPNDREKNLGLKILDEIIGLRLHWYLDGKKFEHICGSNMSPSPLQLLST